MTKPLTLGVIIGNRGMFPDSLIGGGREAVLAALREEGIRPITLDEQATKLGAVETYADALRCAALFKQHADELDGILVSLPNFGEEQGIAEAIQQSGLRLPILVQAFPDELDLLDQAHRRDAWCGKISVCNNLYQYGLPFSVTERHTVHPSSPSFRADLRQFASVCRVVRGLRGARLGAVGARPNAFATTRYSEKLLQDAGISVQTADLSELLGWAGKLADDDARVRERVERTQAYLGTEGVPPAALVRMAKLGIALDDWMQSLCLQATAIQCWDSLQANYGVNICTMMSMMSEQMLPSACEVDVTGAVSMYALQLASGTPSALVDWNNNYGDERDKCVLFHCGNWARSLYAGRPVMENAPILGSVIGIEKTYGVIAGRVPAGPLSFARVSTDDRKGRIKAYVGEGRFTDDPLRTFGSQAVVEVPGLQALMRLICKQGYEHHAAISASQCAAALAEAFETYLGWEVYRHDA